MARILLIATHGSEDPMRAGLAFLFAKGTVEASHRPEVILAGDAAVPRAGVLETLATRAAQGGWQIQSPVRRTPMIDRVARPSAFMSASSTPATISRFEALSCGRIFQRKSPAIVLRIHSSNSCQVPPR
jgi:hypothetical protein